MASRIVLVKVSDNNMKSPIKLYTNLCRKLWEHEGCSEESLLS